MKSRPHRDDLEREADRSLRSKASIAFAFLGLLISADGLLTLLAKMLHYPNPWGEPVFAPFALVIGAVAIVAAVVIRKPAGG